MICVQLVVLVFAEAAVSPVNSAQQLSRGREEGEKVHGKVVSLLLQFALSFGFKHSLLPLFSSVGR